jgi:hypothetical protein
MRLYLFVLSLLLISLNLQAQSKYSQEDMRKLSRIPAKITFDGEVYKSSFHPGIKQDARIPGQYGPDAYSSISVVQISNLRNYYDLESNGTPVQIWQDPSNPDYIHAVYTYSNQEAGWTDRTIQYFWSSDKGTTWSFISNVPFAGRAGFGTITGLSTGVAFIGSHTNSGATSNIRTQFYVDAFPGLGSFTNLDPGGTNNTYVWPRVIATQNTSLTNKFVFVASTSGADASFYGVGTSITSSNFLPYQSIDASPAECYALGRGSDGRIGIVYIIDDARFAGQTGDVYFMESTNAGTSFGTPLKIFDANFATDSLAALRGISIVYKGNSPCVVFETIKQTESGSFFPGSPNKIRFWSSAVNGGNSIVIADENNVPFSPYLGTNDVLAPLSRPSIGISSDGGALFCSMMVASSATGGTDTTSYGEIYLTRSINSGASWYTPERITPLAPRNDWRYASISPSNDVNASNYFVNIIVQKDTIPGSNVNMPDPRTNAKPYFIRVGYPRSVSPPAVPTLLSPANNAVNQPLTPTLSWSGTGEEYRVQVSTNSGFTNIIVDQNIMLNTSYQIPAPILTQSMTYYWRVSATSPGGTSSFSSPFSFTTTSATLPAAPTLITPASGAASVSVTPSFDWSDVSGATSYRFQLSTSNSFNTTIVDSLNVTQSQFSLPVSLSNSTTYYWRVAAKNTAGTGVYSSIFSFSTVLAPPPIVTLISPANGALGIPLTPVMSWEIIPATVTYNLQIATDLNFNNTIYSIMTSSSFHTVAAGTLQLNTLYFWRVRASNAGGPGPYSAVRNFRSTSVSITSIGGIIPTEFKLYNNYPNPFNPSTTIRFDIPKNADVKIKVFDLTGKMVSELIDFSVPPGAYETSFNASKLASGIYYYRIEAGEFIDTKKMMLIK